MQTVRVLHSAFSPRDKSLFRLVVAAVMLVLIGFVTVHLPSIAAQNTDMIFAEEEETTHSPVKEIIAKEVFVSNATYSESPNFFQSSGTLYLHFSEELIPCLHLETDEQPPNFLA